MRRASMLCAVAIGVLGGGISGMGVAVAQLPAVDVPALPTPSPNVPVPKVQVPNLPVADPPKPQLPAVPQPSPLPAVPSVPKLPSLPESPAIPETSTGLPDTSGVVRRVARNSDGTTEPSRTTAPAPSSRTGVLASPAASTPTQPSGAPRSRAAKRSSRRDRAGRHDQTTERGHERRLRRTVRRFAGCLGQLTARQRRVLVLRAGLGAQPTSTRRQIGRRLDVSARRIARIERRGLRELRTRGRDGGCGVAPATAVTTLAATATTASDGRSQPPARGADAPSVTTDKASSGSQPAAGGGRDHSGKSGGPIAFLPALRQDPSDWWIAALMLGLMLLGWALRREFGPTARA